MAKRKLAKSDYMVIFNLHVDGYRNAEIAHKFDVTPSVISKVLHWKFELKTDRSGFRNSNSKLKPEQVEKIHHYRRMGYTYATIGVLMGVSRYQCSKIINKRSWVNNHAA